MATAEEMGYSPNDIAISAFGIKPVGESGHAMVSPTESGAAVVVDVYRILDVDDRAAAVKMVASTDPERIKRNGFGVIPVDMDIFVGGRNDIKRLELAEAGVNIAQWTNTAGNLVEVEVRYPHETKILQVPQPGAIRQQSGGLGDADLM